MKKITSILLLLLIICIGQSYAQKEKYQTIFMYNFGKYVKWPESKLQDKFVIGVLGNSDLTTSLQGMASNNRQAQGLGIEVKQFNSVDEIENCQILFISENFLSKINTISSAARSNATLLVTDAPGMAKKGSMINFVEKDGKIKFELNKKSAESSGLKVSSTLENLAILVDS